MPTTVWHCSFAAADAQSRGDDHDIDDALAVDGTIVRVHALEDTGVPSAQRVLARLEVGDGVLQGAYAGGGGRLVVRRREK